ncbi:diiron oxygenase [Kribbella sp. NPDC056345]|uniref:diiron oxygenase n=1 Tax=Kribbella sp. NPDC056345 TaxID=3345789 RepID=UPI0035DE70D1
MISREPEYRPSLPAWDLRSSVRSRPRRVLSDGGELPLFYSPELTRPAGHKLVVDRGPDDVGELLTRKLYSYLDFTTVLEQEIVNPVVLRLSRDAFGLKLSEEMRFDAHKIYCDEAYHALFSVDVKRQVESISGVVAPTMAEPAFARTIRALKTTLRPDLVDLCASVVSETLISGTLTQIPQDQRVAGFVRETLADHAEDERTHHAYFAQLMEIGWPQLDPESQQLAGPVFADLILAFLRPDLTAYRQMLTAMGFGERAAHAIVAESHPEDELLADVRRGARATLGLLRRTGVLRSARTADYFHLTGLLI